ncbi:MAG TPA: addiction module toxin, HicA family [Bacteroidetes bacterium]|nr:addiction module toxin, HicA family [Bacteroidota bacterium]HEX04464.1 addiction module toxin, HicA family [Bacteroidota bacterium]
MTPRLPTLSSKKLIRVLEKSGFCQDHQTGSHVRLKHANGRVTVVPRHAKDIGRGLLSAILNQTGISRDEFRRLL